MQFEHFPLDLLALQSDERYAILAQIYVTDISFSSLAFSQLNFNVD